MFGSSGDDSGYGRTTPEMRAHFNIGKEDFNQDEDAAPVATISRAMRKSMPQALPSGSRQVQ
jgi:hypothetical protein